MRIFDIFKKNNDYELICEKMAIEFVNLYVKEKGIPFENVTELERQILVVYFFGMSDGLRQNSKIKENSKELAKKIINVMIRTFRYSKEQAEQFFDNMIDNLQSKDSKNTQYVIIHRGIEGYSKWKKDNKKYVLNDVCQIINRINR